MTVKTFPLGSLQTNCHLIASGGSAVAVDPGGDPASVLAELDASGLALTHILVTHMHFDHTAGCAALARATGAPILAPGKDAYLMDTELGAGGFMGFPRIEPFEYESLEPGELELLGQACRVLAVPGHTLGHVAFYFPEPGLLFSGDLLFYRSIGRTDFPGGSLESLKQSVQEEIFTLPEETVVYSGHGGVTSVGDEKRNNPFFTEFMR